MPRCSTRSVPAKTFAILSAVATPSSLPTPRGAGGTSGGVGEFFLGLILAVVGGYLLLNQVQVTTSFWNFGRYGGFGLTLLPLLIGVAMLFYDGKSIVGWALTGLGAAIILAGMPVVNLDIYFQQTSHIQHPHDAGHAVRWSRLARTLAARRVTARPSSRFS